MTKAPFKLRSGNTSTFKNLGSSPAKKERLIGSSSPSPRFTSPVDHPDGPAGNDSSTEGGGNELKTKNNQNNQNNKNNKGPIMPKSKPFNPPPPSNNKNKGTLKGITNFEYDFPIANKVIESHNEVVKKGFGIIKNNAKKLHSYLTKK